MTPRPPAAHDAAVLRRGSAAVAGATLVVAAVFAGVSGSGGALGALLGGVTVVAFFGSDNLLSSWLRSAPPVMVMAAAFGWYATKISLLALVLLPMRGTDAFDVRALAAAVGAGTVAWLTAAVVVFSRRRLLYVDAGHGAV